MNVPAYAEKIEALRTQITMDLYLPISQMPERLRAAQALLEQISRCSEMNARSSLLLPQIKRSITEYYTSATGRAWNQKFIFHDLGVLEELCGPDAASLPPRDRRFKPALPRPLDS